MSIDLILHLNNVVMAILLSLRHVLMLTRVINREQNMSNFCHRLSKILDGNHGYLHLLKLGKQFDLQYFDLGLMPCRNISNSDWFWFVSKWNASISLLPLQQMNRGIKTCQQSAGSCHKGDTQSAYTSSLYGCVMSLTWLSWLYKVKILCKD